MEDIRELRERYGSGKFLFFQTKLEKNIRDIKKAFSLIPNVLPAYSVKANYYAPLLMQAYQSGFHFDVASAAELLKLLKIGVAPERIWLNTPYLPEDLIKQCVDMGVMIHADSLEQLRNIEKEAAARGKLVEIGLRFNFPDLEPSRFGIENSEEELEELMKILCSDFLSVKTLHTHFSGKDRSAASWAARAGKLYRLYMDRFSDREVSRLNIGGGISGPMPPDLERHFDYEVPGWKEYAKAVFEALPGFSETGLTLALEPGMALVADTFSFLAEVIDMKKTGERNIALLNSSQLFLKPTGHGVPLSVKVYNYRPGGHEQTYELTGMSCMERDVLGSYEGVLEPGDIFLFGNVGAYTLSYRPDFIFTQPEVIVVK